MAYKKFAFIQALRGVAVLLVVLYHFPGAFSVSKTGYIGVDLFFVISGFIMVATTSHLQGGIRDFAIFAIKRLTRIWPTYFVASAAMAIVFYVLLGDERAIGLDLVKSLVFYPLWAKGAVDFPGWTLNFEIYFYAVFALTLLLPRGRLLLLAIGIAFGQCILPWLLLGKFQPFGPDYGFPGDGLSAYLAMISNKIVWSFLFGAVVGSVATSGIRIENRALAFTLSAPFWAIAVYMMYWFGHAIDHGPWYGAVFSLAVLPLALHDKVKPIGAPRLLTLIGNASYSLYVTHWIVARFFMDWWNGVYYASDNRIAAMLFAYVALIAAITIPTYLFVELRLSNGVRDILLSLVPSRRLINPRDNNDSAIGAGIGVVIEADRHR